MTGNVWKTMGLIALSVGPLLAQTTSTAPPRTELPFAAETISVSGTGKTMVMPDRFSFTVGVQTQAPAVEDAVEQNNRKVAAVIAALKKAGTTDSEIKTSGFYINPQQEYQERMPPRVVGYQVSNNVTVTRETMSDAGKLLQVAVAAGVNQASGLNFTVSDPAKGRDEGLGRAFADARARAAALAQAAGRTLGRALSITEGGGSYPQPVPIYARGMASMAAKAEVSEVPVESGTQENTYTVAVVFELR
jgi:uncharacterized protein YggE